MDDCLFDYKHLLVARYSGQICGVCVINDGEAKWDKKTIKQRIGAHYLPENQEEGFDYASEHYFEEICDKSMEPDCIELVAFCVEEGFRRKHIGNAMLDKLIELYPDKTIELTVLANNASAIELYEQKGFTNYQCDKENKGTGFAPKGLRKPMVNHMRRVPQ